MRKHSAFLFEETSGGIDAWRHRTNGLHVLLMPNPAVPVATFMITYRVGSRNEGAGLTGATHMLEHLMFKGTERFNKEAGTSVFNLLQRVGARVNATTWLDRTNYYELLPKEHLPLAIEIEADRMRGARISLNDLESERSVILNEFDRGDNEPMRKLYHAVWSTAFVAHPYHHPTIGWRSDIEHATQEGLRHFYDTYYWPNNATVSVIGDFEPEAVLDTLEKHFGPIPASAHPIPDVTTREPEQLGERRVTIRQSGQLGMVMLAWKQPDAHHEDADALDMLSMVLASGKNSRLYRNLVAKGLATHQMASASRLRNPGLFYLLGLLAPERSHDEVEQALRNEVIRIQTEGITEAELTRATNQLRAQEAFNRDGGFGIASQLNEAIAAGDWKLFTTFFENVQRVTPADVQRVAQTWLTDDRCTVGWYVPTVPAGAPA